jgi:hypothetical protein
LLVPPGFGVPAPLVRALGQKGLEPPVVTDPPTVMLALIERPSRVVIAVEPAQIVGLSALAQAMADHFPSAELWQLLGGPNRPSLHRVTPSDAGHRPPPWEASAASDTLESGPAQAERAVAGHVHGQSAQQAGEGEGTAESDETMAASVSAAELAMLLGRAEPPAEMEGDVSEHDHASFQ